MYTTQLQPLKIKQVSAIILSSHFNRERPKALLLIWKRVTLKSKMSLTTLSGAGRGSLQACKQLAAVLSGMPSQGGTVPNHIAGFSGQGPTVLQPLQLGKTRPQGQ